jgi:hypothetical protein
MPSLSTVTPSILMVLALLLVSCSTPPPTRLISGRVVDLDHRPVGNVSLSIGTVAATSDAQGQFSAKLVGVQPDGVFNAVVRSGNKAVLVYQDLNRDDLVLLYPHQSAANPYATPIRGAVIDNDDTCIDKKTKLVFAGPAASGRIRSCLKSLMLDFRIEPTLIESCKHRQQLH